MCDGIAYSRRVVIGYFALHVGPRGGAEAGPLVALVHVLVWLTPFAVSTFLLFARTTNVEAAKRAVENEAARVKAERDAFVEFGDRMREVDVVAPSEIAGGPVAVRQVPAGNLEKVRSAYEDTVMATDHYDEDYGETFSENIHAEFSPDVAVAVEQGVAMTPPLRAALVSESEECRREREEFLDVLEDEHEALSAAESALDVELRRFESPLLRYSYDQLRERWDHVAEVRRRLESLVDERQRRIQDGYLPGSMIDDGVSFHEYLYADLETRHPILSDAMCALGDVVDFQHELERSMARRV